ncbi:unnamed protein product [Mytilus coruscus]|uniref:Uncharacterized protein n=1 Tax=Mytilus coruscus TaxID=42192 RepID=A0A6J8BPM1_MYTCO|nr:unnamed protein product [Mytilus coruscus]
MNESAAVSEKYTKDLHHTPIEQRIKLLTKKPRDSSEKYVKDMKGDHSSLGREHLNIGEETSFITYGQPVNIFPKRKSPELQENGNDISGDAEAQIHADIGAKNASNPTNREKVESKSNLENNEDKGSMKDLNSSQKDDTNDETSFLNDSEGEKSKSIIMANDEDKESKKDLNSCQKEDIDEPAEEDKEEDESDSLTSKTEYLFLSDASDKKNIRSSKKLCGLDKNNGTSLLNGLNEKKI